MITAALAGTALWATFSSSIFASATVKAAKHFDVSLEVMTLGTSLMVLGYMIGPLVWGPLSELYGRKIPLFSGYFIFAVFQIPVAVAQNVQTIMVCRFIQGVFGCSPLSIVAGAMVDFWDPVGRGLAISLFAAATFLGPTLGPIVSVQCLDDYIYVCAHANPNMQRWLPYRFTPWLAVDFLDHTDRIILLRNHWVLYHTRDLRARPSATTRGSSAA